MFLLAVLYVFASYWIFQSAKKESVANAQSFVNLVHHQWEREVLVETDKVTGILSNLHIVKDYFDVDDSDKRIILFEINRLLRSLYNETGWSVSLYNADGVEFAAVEKGRLKNRGWDVLSEKEGIINHLFHDIKEKNDSTPVSKYDFPSRRLYTISEIKNPQYNIPNGYIIIKRNIEFFSESISNVKINDMEIVWLFSENFDLIQSPNNKMYFSVFPLGDLSTHGLEDGASLFIDSGYFSIHPLYSEGGSKPVLYIGVSLPFDYMKDLNLILENNLIWSAFLCFSLAFFMMMLFWKKIGKLAREHEDVISLARTDSLTSVFSRGYFEGKVTEKLKKVDKAMLVLLDIGGLKKVNDLYGYKVGDKMLIEVARKLKDAVGDKGIVGRFSGAEFHVAIFEGEFITAIEDIKSISSESINIQGKSLKPKIETGAAIYPEHANSFSRLLSSADIALAGAKAGEESHVFYSKGLGEKYSEQIDIEFGVVQAIDNDEFFFHFQPQVDASTNRIIGYELLLRWESPQFGFISPGVFIPIIEAKGLSEKVNIYVVKLALKLTKGMQQMWDDGEVVKFAINLSPSVLNMSEHLEYLNQVVTDSEVNSNKCKIVLEITESGLISDSGDLKHKIITSMNKLRGDGIGLALDDFGVEYSSLNRLIEYPFEFVKIDRCFVQKLEGPESKATKATIKAIVSLKEELNFSIIVEGVENKQQLDMLKDMDCFIIQGFYFYRPMPIDSIIKQLDQGLEVNHNFD